MKNLLTKILFISLLLSAAMPSIIQSMDDSSSLLPTAVQPMGDSSELLSLIEVVRTERIKARIERIKARTERIKVLKEGAIFTIGHIVGDYAGKKLAQATGKDTYFSIRGIPIITAKDITHTATTAVISCARGNEHKKTTTLIIEKFVLNKMEAMEQDVWCRIVKSHPTIATIDQWFCNHPEITYILKSVVISNANNMVLTRLKKVSY